jgi:hypothetical protein
MFQHHLGNWVLVTGAMWHYRKKMHCRAARRCRAPCARQRSLCHPMARNCTAKNGDMAKNEENTRQRPLDGKDPSGRTVKKM